MAVLIEAWNVIVNDNRIEKADGIRDAFLKNIPSKAYCSDGTSVDIVVIDMLKGSTTKCDWIAYKRDKLFNYRTEYKKSHEDFSIAWHIECFEGNRDNYAVFYPENNFADSEFTESGISFPFGWNPDEAIYTSDHTSKPEEELEEISRTESIITYRRKSTSEIVYVGISKTENNNDLTDEKIDHFNILFDKATTRFEPYLLLDNQSYGYVGWFVELKIKKSIKELKQCLEIIPNHLNSIFFLGKCYQSLGDINLSLQYFEQGLSTEFSELNYKEDLSKFQRLLNYCLLEASVTYAKIGNFEKAIDYSNKLIDKDPENISVLTNLAMNYIIKGKDSEANEIIGKALSIAPDDLILRRVIEFQDKIKTDLIPRPKTWNEFTD